MKNATITFKAKPVTVWNGDIKEQWIKIPKLSSSHCDMQAFRFHSKYGAYANSDLFLSMLGRIRNEKFGEREYIKLHNIPEGVNVDASGFLAIVSFSV